MIAQSFRRQAASRPELAAGLGNALQGLREEGYVAASIDRVRAFLGVDPISQDPELWSTGALVDTGLVTQGGSGAAPMVLDQGLLYFAVDWRMEVELAEYLSALSRSPAIGQWQPPSDLALGSDQRQALQHAMNHRLTVVSGGPGTGKTTLVGHLIRCWLSADGDPGSLLIAAPTGRAAARLSAAVANSVEQPLPPAKTLHRALGWSPSQVRFRYGADHQLSAQLVIVDEVSMADLGLMHALFSALGPNAQVVLLGDRDQLVSVQPGSVMADLCHGLAGSSISHCLQSLTENFRYGDTSGIAGVARAIGNGNVDELFEQLAASADVTLLPGLNSLDDICAGWLDRPAGQSPELAWQQLGSRRILCAHRSGPAGVNRINTMVFRWLQRHGQMAGRFVDDQQAYPGRLFSLLGNHYDAGFFNGDQGFIAESEGGLVAWLESSDQSLRSLSPSRLPPVESAFAMTVHRAQGSEFGKVHCILPASSSPLLTRELLYTAVTRARHEVVIYADRAAIEKAVRTPGSRGSGLAARLLALSRVGSAPAFQPSLF